MQSTITFTSTLSANLMSWLTRHSRESKKTKRTIIEEALIKYRQDVKRKRMEESFRRVSADPEMQSMAEEGIDDYIEQLKQFEL